jgi:hypothetical protein
MGTQPSAATKGPTAQLAQFAATYPFSRIPHELLPLFHTYLLDNAATSGHKTVKDTKCSASLESSKVRRGLVVDS